MPRTQEWEGYRVLFYSNEHLPAHVHFKKGAQDVKIVLRTLAVEDVGRGTSAKIQRKMVKYVFEHRQELLSKWNTYFSQRDRKELVEKW